MTVTRLGRVTTLGRAMILAAGGFALLGGWGGELRAEQEGHEAALLGNVRQLTFEGRRAGEGYFNADGTSSCSRASARRTIPSIRST